MSKPPFYKFDQFCAGLKINSKNLGVVPFVLWTPQIYYLRKLQKGFEKGIREFLTNKSRQGGITTVDLAILDYWMNRYKGTLAAMIADDGSNITRARAILTGFMEHSKPGLHIGHDYYGHHNNFELMLDNFSVLSYLIAGKKKKTAESGDLGQGKGFNLSIATEVASYADAKQIDKIKDSFSLTHPNRLYLWESTANGFNHWYDMCKTAEHATTQMLVFLGWWLHPDYRVSRESNEFRVYWDGSLTTEEKRNVRDVKQLYGKEFREIMGYDLEITPEQIAWYRLQYFEHKREDINALYQEHPWTNEQSFIMSGYKFFSSDRLTAAYKAAIAKPFEAWRYTFGTDFPDTRVHKTNAINAQLKIWHHPVPNGVYALGADPAYGYNPESDQSVLPIYRCYADRMVQVAEFCSSGVRTDEFAWVILHLVGWYRNIYVNLEITGPGAAVLSELKNVKKRQQILASQGQVNFADTQSCMKHFLYSRQDSLTQSFNLHTKTTEQEKEDMLNTFKGLFETERIEINSAPTINEMKYFGRIGGSLEGMGGEFDDRVIGTALAVLAWMRWIRPSMSTQNHTYKFVTDQEAEHKTPEQNMVLDFLKGRGIQV